MRLSKTEYKMGVQCPKSLWLKYNKPNAFNKDYGNERIFANGHIVGEHAQKLFPNGVLVNWDKNIDSMVMKTRQLIDVGQTVIYEATFAIPNSLTMCDILKKNGDSWDIYEVKSSTHIKEEYYEDVAFQYYLLSNAGVSVSNIYTIYINNQYERDIDLELDKLFVIADVTEIAKARLNDVSCKMKSIQNTLVQTLEPKINIGNHCFEPYECPCKNYCWSHIPEYSVFSLAGMRKNKMFKLYEDGICTYQDILANNVSLSDKNKFQVHSHINNTKIILKEEIRDFLNTLSMSLYFLDFETFQQPVPLYSKLNPYEQIPFQYSLHYYVKDDGVLEHKEFLAKEGQDPRRDFAESLIRDIPDNVCVVAYNMSFEKSVLKRLAERYSDLQEHLIKIHDNMRDIMVPFQKNYYYTKEMQGSYSIKYVLPALYPDDPELKYDRLNVKNGDEAMTVFSELHRKSPEEIKQVRKDLLEYCKLDTLAMVKVWEFLCRLVYKNNTWM
jgi:predicted RecB family nuclease